MQVNYETRNNKKQGVSSIITNIKSEDVKTKAGKNRYASMMKYFSEQFIGFLEFYKGDEIIEDAKNKGIDLSSAILIPHKYGKALCFGGYYSHKPEFSPYINFTTHNFLRGWTFSTGHFADVTIYTDSEYLMCVTRDCHLDHDYFLLWLFEQMEMYFYDTDFDIPSCNKTLNWCNKMEIQFSEFEYCEQFRGLAKDYENIVAKNKSKRVDTLKVNGVLVVDYIKQHRIFRYAHSSNEIFNMSLFFEKPYEQLHRYIEKANVVF